MLNRSSKEPNIFLSNYLVGTRYEFIPRSFPQQIGQDPPVYSKEVCFSLFPNPHLEAAARKPKFGYYEMSGSTC